MHNELCDRAASQPAYFVHADQGITKGKIKTQTKKNKAIPDGYVWLFFMAGMATTKSQEPL